MALDGTNLVSMRKEKVNCHLPEEFASWSTGSFDVTGVPFLKEPTFCLNFLELMRVTILILLGEEIWPLSMFTLIKF